MSLDRLRGLDTEGVEDRRDEVDRVVVLVADLTTRPGPGTLARAQSDGRREGLWVDAARHHDLPRRDDVVVVLVESGLFFANADHVRQAIRDQVTQATVAVVLDAETTP